MSDVKVSVIIPIYNMEKYIRECLDSVCAQTLKEIEILCVNDGSTDSSGDIVREYSNKDDRVILISKDNEGVGKARNTGIDNAKGEFIAFMDPDDYYPDSDVLQVMYDAAVENGVCICGGSVCENRDGIVYETGVNAKMVFKTDQMVKFCDYQYDYGFWRFIYSRKFINENDIRFPAYIRYQDPPFFVRAMALAGEFYALSKKTYCYRVASQAIAWTPKKLLHLLYGIRDCMVLSNENGFNNMGKNTIKHMSDNYVSRYRKILDSLTIEYVEMFFEICENVSSDMIREQRDYIFARNRVVQFAGGVLAINEDKWSKTEKDRVEGLKAREAALISRIKSDNEELKNYALEKNFVWAERIWDVGEAIQITKEQRESILKRNRDNGFRCIVQRKSSIKPIVSVVIPVYNVEDYLEKCVESVINQTLKEIEIICVNDGATDGSPDILMRLAKTDDRIIVCEQLNSGLSATRNAGVRQASGKYLYFMDSDDILEKDALKCLVDRCEEQNLDVCYFDGESFTDDEMPVEVLSTFMSYYKRNRLTEDKRSGVDMLKDMINCEEYRTSACLQITRTDHFINNDLWFIEGIVHEDNFFTFKNLMTAENAGYINKPFFNRRLRASSIMTATRSYKNVYGYFVSYMNMLDCAEKASLNEEQQDSVNELLRRVFYNAKNIYCELSEAHNNFALALDKKERLLFELYVEGSQSVNNSNKIIHSRLKEAFDEKSEIKAILQRTYDEKSELKVVLKKTYDEKAERGQKIKKLEAEKAERGVKIKRLEGEKAERGIKIKKLEGEKAERGVKIRQLERDKAENLERISNLEREVYDLRNSASFKVGSVITWPLRMMKKVAKKIVRTLKSR